MKKLLAILLSVIMVLSLVACGNKTQDETPSNDDQQQNTETETKTIKVGLICIGDENDQGYTYNFIRGKESATEALAAKGINVDWVVKYNIGEDSTCEDANIELAEDGCDIIINNSYGFEPFMLKVAPDYPEIEFISCTNQASAVDDLDNTHNAFANIYEGRYLAGVAGGMKLQQMIDEGTITAEEAVIGYVAAFPFAEVVSGYTAFYQGAKSDAVAAFLPVYDNLERALKQETADEAYKKGVEMTMTQLKEVLAKLGIEEIPALGEPFDPNLHNAVMHVEDEGAGENIIVDVFQTGFRSGDKVVRFAMVKVAN